MQRNSPITDPITKMGVAHTSWPYDNTYFLKFPLLNLALVAEEYKMEECGHCKRNEKDGPD